MYTFIFKKNPLQGPAEHESPQSTQMGGSRGLDGCHFTTDDTAGQAFHIKQMEKRNILKKEWEWQSHHEQN